MGTQRKRKMGQQCRHAAREAEIFGRFTTSVVCRGIEGESLVWHVIGRIYFCDGEPHGTYRRPLSLSAHFFSPSALSFCFLGASPGRLLLPREFSHFLSVITCPCRESKSSSHVCSLFCACLFFVSPTPSSFRAQNCSASRVYSAFPSLSDIFGNLKSMIWIAGCIN